MSRLIEESRAGPRVRLKTRGLSNFRLKVIGLVLVLLSALGSTVVRHGMPVDLNTADFSQLTTAVVLQLVSWMAFPIYAWLVFDGFAHTSNRWAYGVRLAILAVVSEVPYDLATSGKVWDLSSQNPVFALVVCLVVLCLVDRFKCRGGAGSLPLIILVILAGVVWLGFFNVALRLGVMPGGILLLVFCLIFYFFDGRDTVMQWVAAIVGALAVVLPAFGVVILHFRNGEPGVRHPGQRYVFYILYPLCLLLLALVR